MSCGKSNKCTVKLWGISENSQQPFPAVERDWKDYSSETTDNLQLENKGNRWSAFCSSQPLHSQKFPCFLPVPMWFICTLSLFTPKPTRRGQLRGSADQQELRANIFWLRADDNAAHKGITEFWWMYLLNTFYSPLRCTEVSQRG